MTLRRSKYTEGIPPHQTTTIQTKQDKQPKKFKVFQILHLSIQSIEEIRLIDQLLKCNLKKQEKQTLIKKCNVIIMQIKEQMDEIVQVSKHYQGKEKLLIEGEEITYQEWRMQIKKIQRKFLEQMNHINKHIGVISKVHEIPYQIFNIGEIEWRKKCQMNMKEMKGCFIC